jgi:putative metalloprotease
MRQKIQVSSLADAGRDLLAASGNQMAVQFSQSQIATLSQAFINAQFSQNEESQADAYGVSFLKRHHYDPHAAITAMQKLQAATGDDHSWLADHPASSMRTQHISLLVAGVPQSKIPTNNVSDILSRIGASLGGGGSTGPQVTSERASK